MPLEDLKRKLKRAKAIKIKLSKVKIGLPKKVVFIYSQGKVTAFPKERKWVIEVKGKKAITGLVKSGNRNDVTKYKAKFYLKLAILKLI